MRFCFLAASLSASFGASRGASRMASVVRPDPRTGRLVRNLVVAPRPVPIRLVPPQIAPAGGGDAEIITAPDPNLNSLVEETARQYDVNPYLVHSVIQVESNYNPRAISPKGAQGLMQLMPATARRFGVRNTLDPKENILGGVRYLKFLQETFKDDRLAIAAYNAGEAAVMKYNNVPPYAETMDYVVRVGRRYGAAKRAAEKRKKAASKKTAPLQAAEPAPEPERHIAQFFDGSGRLHITTQ